jgi:1,4-dihydroxy-2-naphthoate octaprenyltransferase
MSNTLEGATLRATPLVAARAFPAIRPGSLHAWLIAIRPRTLLVAISPVLVGAALGFERTGSIDFAAALLVLGAALLMQIATNLQNDVGYTLRGADRGGARVGLPRATAQGWLSIRQVRIGILIVALTAVALGCLLVAYRGWPVLLIGSISLLAALAYMGGPKPIAYTPFGEATVFLFFGIVAVVGTDWVLTGGAGFVTVLAAIAIGSLAAAALAVNNHRDREHDRSVGRRTFAVLRGEAGSQRLYATLLLVPFVLVPAMALGLHGAALLLPWLSLPFALRLRHRFLHCPNGAALNGILFSTFRLELAFALLLAGGALLTRALH